MGHTQSVDRGSDALFLKTGAAEDRAVLRGAERHGSFFTAGEALRTCFHAHPHAPALGFARFTTLGIVLKLFVVEKELFARCKHEITSAVIALENSIRKLHGRFPHAGKMDRKSAVIARDEPVLFP